MTRRPPLAALAAVAALALGAPAAPAASPTPRAAEGAAVPAEGDRARPTRPAVCPATAESRLRRLGLRLPRPFTPVGTYVNAVRTGDRLVLGGHVPIDARGGIALGRLGQDLDVAQGRRAARLAVLSALATIRDQVGSLDRVRRVVSVLGVVNATPDFTRHTQVVDGASDVLVALWGRRGRHTRLAVGVSSLPANLALEVSMTVELSPCRTAVT